uniref:Uncharacterized protein n=1 Tax=Setaria digitata TaxID=48799 RepID=A0A915PCU8_9BILA
MHHLEERLSALVECFSVKRNIVQPFPANKSDGAIVNLQDALGQNNISSGSPNLDIFGLALETSSEKEWVFLCATFLIICNRNPKKQYFPLRLQQE